MKATEEKLITKWLDYLAGELDEKEISELHQDLDHFPELKKELMSDHVLWENLDRIEIPVPSPEMDTRQWVAGQRPGTTAGGPIRADVRVSSGPDGSGTGQAPCGTGYGRIRYRSGGGDGLDHAVPPCDS